MTTYIDIVSTDNLVESYRYSSGSWVEKVGKHVSDIYGSNYVVTTDAYYECWSDIKDKNDKCDVAEWWHYDSYTYDESDHKYLLLLSDKDWDAGCAFGGAAVATVGPDLFDVPDPSNIGTFYTGYGYGSGMLNACIHEIGHCFGMSYNDGYMEYDSSEDINSRSPMAGKPTETSNNCGESVNKSKYAHDEYLHGYYSSCETQYLPELISKAYGSWVF